MAGRALTRGADAGVPDGIKPPARLAACDPLSLSTVFRGVQVLQTAITGLPIHEIRGGVKLDTVSSIVLQPDVNRSRRDFLADMVASMVLDGNAFVRLVRFAGDVVSCEVLPPSLVTVSDDGTDPASPKLRYSYLGHDYTSDQIVHCKFLNVPGRLRGLGPISAAREEVEAAQMARTYKAKFYSDGSNLKGYLQTEDKVTPPDCQGRQGGVESHGRGRRREGARLETQIRAAGHETGRLAVSRNAEIRYHADSPAARHPRQHHACGR